MENATALYGHSFRAGTAGIRLGDAYNIGLMIIGD